MCMKSATYLAKIRFFAQLTAGFSNGVGGGEFLCHRCFGCQGCLGGVRIASVPVSVREKRCRLVGVRVFPTVRPFVLFLSGMLRGLSFPALHVFEEYLGMCSMCRQNPFREGVESILSTDRIFPNHGGMFFLLSGRLGSFRRVAERLVRRCLQTSCNVCEK